jgi:hypothetical protein
MRASTIAHAIERDLLTDRPRIEHKSQTCFACGRSYMNGDRDNPRFCSPRCRKAFDAGFVGPYSEQPIRYARLDGRPMQPRGDGFVIQCAGCRQEFVSKGLRCCSPECERQVRERAEIEQTIAEAGLESVGRVKRKCEAPGCGATIPMWRNKRKVSGAARFCSDRCARKARRANTSKNAPGSDLSPSPDLSPETRQKCP